jgi:superfamily II DNA or RNA helicase
MEITVLLPLQWKECLAKDPVRIILEARRDDETQTQPFDAAMRGLGNGFAVGEDDERVLAALELLTGTVSGINAVPRGKIGVFLRALADHPRVWLGKKQRVEVRASAGRPSIIFSTRPDGLELTATGKATNATVIDRRYMMELPIPGWSFDGRQIVEMPPLPAGFSSDSRVVPQAQIPDFLTREFPALERSCELVFAPGFEEFRLEIGQPAFEARLEGALSGLTLELIAHYGDKEFSLTGKTESSAYQRYVPDARQPNRFWRRNIRAEREALAQAEAAGFSLVRSGAATFSLIAENQVARFLANTLPRWRRAWTVSFGSRLEATMAEIDVAQPEFSLRPGPGSGSGEDWLSLDLKLSVQGKPVPLDPAEIQRWLQTGQTHGRMTDKRVLLVPTEAWSEMKEVLADCEVDQEPGKIRIARTFAPYLAGALTAQGFRAGENVAANFLPPDVKAALDAKLWAQLRPYQAHGVEWLAGLAQRNLHGLLADDMGLGKTLQALAFCAWLKVWRDDLLVVRGPAGAGPSRGYCLVVCPTSLVTNWLREAARFTPQLRTLDLTGADRAEKFGRRKEYDLLVTSYAILRRDVEHYRADEFSLVILDEAQHIKNRGSQNAQSAKALRARHRLILTGTPLENSVLDLWSLYDFLLPGYLGTASDFRERYETPLTKDVSGVPAGTPDARVMERLRHRVRPFFLRRTKEEVLTELPPKLEFPTLCELTDEQREVYRAVLAQGRREVFEHSGKSGQGRDRIAVLTTLLRLRQVCCHLDLLPTADQRETEFRGDQGRSQVQLGNEGARRWKEPSAKMDRTFELIDEAMDGGHRVLLFSQFVRVLHLLRDEAKRRGLRFCYLDGQTVERQAEVDRFQEDAEIPLFFISLKAGGTGLNLTGADTVIHFDPWWNPAVEEQATSRAHRMGQSRSVQAYKLIAAGTVEEKIQALQARKRELFQASMGGDEAFVEKLTGEDLEELLTE